MAIGDCCRHDRDGYRRGEIMLSSLSLSLSLSLCRSLSVCLSVCIRGPSQPNYATESKTAISRESVSSLINVEKKKAPPLSIYKLINDLLKRAAIFTLPLIVSSLPHNPLPAHTHTHTHTLPPTTSHTHTHTHPLSASFCAARGAKWIGVFFLEGTCCIVGVSLAVQDVSRRLFAASGRLGWNT